MHAHPPTDNINEHVKIIAPQTSITSSIKLIKPELKQPVGSKQETVFWTCLMKE